MPNALWVRVSRFVPNFIRGLQGFGSCSHCGYYWGVVEGKEIHYSSSRGMFPICTECFEKLSADEIIVYCNRLVDEWQDYGHLDTDPVEIRRAVVLEVHEMKAPCSARNTEWTTLEELRPGAVFETRDGTIAVKSGYYYSKAVNPQCECVLLESGEYGHFTNSNNTDVREIYVR